MSAIESYQAPINAYTHYRNGQNVYTDIWVMTLSSLLWTGKKNTYVITHIDNNHIYTKIQYIYTYNLKNHNPIMEWTKGWDNR